MYRTTVAAPVAALSVVTAGGRVYLRREDTVEETRLSRPDMTQVADPRDGSVRTINVSPDWVTTSGYLIAGKWAISAYRWG